MQKIKSLQYLRALAALAVVFFHASDRLGLRAIGDIGAAGVDVFFIISGFVMWSVTARKPTSPIEFIRHRIIRIVPLYWLFTGVVVVTALAIPSAFPHIRLTVNHVLLSLLFIPHVSLNEGQIFPVIPAGWTLNCEMVFYVIFAVSLFLPPRRRLWIVVSVLSALAMFGVFYEGENQIVLTYTSVLLLEFAAGLVLGRLWELRILPRRRLSWLMAALGIAGFIAAAIIKPSGAYRIITWGIPAFLLVTGLVAVETDGGIFENKLLERTGDASYSIYLVHVNLVALLMKFWPPTPSLISSCAFMIVSLISATVTGMISYRLFERPLIALYRRRPEILPLDGA